MAYNNFTLPELRQRFGVSNQQTTNLFDAVAQVEIPPVLARNLERQIPLAFNLNTEKAKSELIIAPILLELKFQLHQRIGFFSGVEFTIDQNQGLNGRCDFLIARDPDQLQIVAPVCMLVEAKNENIIGGIPQAIAEMVAARKYNEQTGTPIDPIYGAVTTGLNWRFLKLSADVAHIDVLDYPIAAIGRIYAILQLMALGE